VRFGCINMRKELLAMEWSLGRAILGAGIGALVALLVAVIVSRQFTDLTAETNAIIMGEMERNQTMSYPEAMAELEKLLHRIAQTGGWRGFLAQRILRNGGLGFPEVNRPTVRVWLWVCAVGALIGTVGASAEWWVVLLTTAALAVGVPIIIEGPVAISTIQLGGLAGGAVATVFLRIAGNWSSSVGGAGEPLGQ
jgi:hypothetical protein